MFKNKAGQTVVLLAIDTAHNKPCVGDAPNITAYVKLDNADVIALADSSAREEDPVRAAGLVTFDLTQAETNGDRAIYSGTSTTPGIVIIPKEYALAPVPPGSVGPIAVDHNYGGTNALSFETADGRGIEHATIQIFLKSDWDASHRTAAYIRGQTTTIIGGHWLSPIMLEAGMYTVLAFREGIYMPSTKTVVVTA